MPSNLSGMRGDSNLTRAAEALKASRNTVRKYLEEK